MFDLSLRRQQMPYASKALIQPRFPGDLNPTFHLPVFFFDYIFAFH